MTVTESRHAKQQTIAEGPPNRRSGSANAYPRLEIEEAPLQLKIWASGEG